MRINGTKYFRLVKEVLLICKKENRVRQSIIEKYRRNRKLRVTKYRCKYTHYFRNEKTFDVFLDFLLEFITFALIKER